MRQLNGVYTQTSNRRHGRSGHVFQGGYKAILVEGDAYLLELTRYVVLNPVRARMVGVPGDWRWSSYLDMVGERSPPEWLATEGLLAQFATDQEETVRRCVAFVGEGIGKESIWRDLNRQIFLGNDAFVERTQAESEGLSKTVGVPKAQKRPPAPPLDEFASRYKDGILAIVAAYATDQYSYQQIGNFYGLHFITIGKILRKARASQ